MKYILIISLLLYIHSVSLAQDSRIKAMVDSLRFMYADTLDCSAQIYWRIVAQGVKAVPFLIDELTDTTPTMVKFYCKNTRLNIGEVCHFALEEIGDIPMFLVTRMQFDFFHRKNGGDCWSFYDWLFDNSNKVVYQNTIRRWFKTNKSKYVIKRIAKSKLSECQKMYHIYSYYLYKG